jgi:hypothetical protein
MCVHHPDVTFNPLEVVDFFFLGTQQLAGALQRIGPPTPSSDQVNLRLEQLDSIFLFLKIKAILLFLSKRERRKD